MNKLSIIFTLFLSPLAFGEVHILHEEKLDLDKDGKKDSIAWVGKTKEDKRPSRLVIRTKGKTLLDVSANFCGQNETSSDCIPLTVMKRLTSRKEPLIIFKSGESTWTYRLQSGAFRPYLASYVSKTDRVEVNYTTNRALISGAKKTETCPLKSNRANEDVSTFQMFDIQQETNCAKL